MEKVTFKDVARLAGVSTQTVSRVTNNTGSVNEQTRQRVQAAIAELGYVPNKSAQLLGRRRSRLLGLITLDLTFFGAAMVAGGVRRAAQERGYSLALAITNEVSSEQINKAVQELRAQQADALIINMPVPPQQATALSKTYPDLPIVFADAYPGSGIVTVMSDHEQGAQLIIEHLLSNQRRSFLLVHGSEDSPAALLRQQGWLKALHSRGITPIGEVIGNWSALEAYDRITAFLTTHADIDAILCANDQMALGALKALHEQNIAVPGAIAVAGFDDTPDSIMYQPALTTVRQDFAALGQAIVENTLQQLNGKQHAQTTTMPVELVIRASSTQSQAERRTGTTSAPFS